MQTMHVYQILTHYTSLQEPDTGFKVLDNSVNEGPDWFEYWPIRTFLLDEALDEDADYSFLSPKFQLKTSLSSDVVRANYFIAKPRFWRAWLAVNEKMFAIAETSSDALGQATSCRSPLCAMR